MHATVIIDHSLRHGLLCGLLVGNGTSLCAHLTLPPLTHHHCQPCQAGRRTASSPSGDQAVHKPGSAAEEQQSNASKTARHNKLCSARPATMQRLPLLVWQQCTITAVLRVLCNQQTPAGPHQHSYFQSHPGRTQTGLAAPTQPCIVHTEHQTRQDAASPSLKHT